MEEMRLSAPPRFMATHSINPRSSKVIALKISVETSPSELIVYFSPEVKRFPDLRQVMNGNGVPCVLQSMVTRVPLKTMRLVPMDMRAGFNDVVESTSPFWERISAVLSPGGGCFQIITS